MKDFIKERLNELLNEKALGISDLPNDIALFSCPVSGLYLILYSPSLKKIYGMIFSYAAGKINVDNQLVNIQSIAQVAAESGFGPFMYDALMSINYPNCIMPDRNGMVKKDALNIYEYLYNKRKDTVLITLQPNNKYFYFDILGKSNSKLTPEQKVALYNKKPDDVKFKLNVFNTCFRYSNPEYLKLINLGKKYVKEGIVDIKTLQRDSVLFFEKKYR